MHFHSALIKYQYKTCQMIDLSEKNVSLYAEAEAMLALTLDCLPVAKLPHYFLGPFICQSLRYVCEPRDRLCRCKFFCPPGSRHGTDRCL